ncbi:MAG TPA: RND transporter [Gammaproteobacteria bacterium]|nr:RND transporter [Gammaproteobacteria bacterium]
MKSVFRALAAVGLLLSFSVAAANQLAEGTVKRIDAPSQRVMLAHGPLPSIGMGSMTMMFKVRDAAMLKPLKVGDKVRFQVEDIGGNFTITRIEARR